MKKPATTPTMKQFIAKQQAIVKNIAKAQQQVNATLKAQGKQSVTFPQGRGCGHVLGGIVSAQ